jgi:hypothetical protein
VPSAIRRFIPPVVEMADEINESKCEWLLKLAKWNADCIFVGAIAFGSPLLGRGGSAMIYANERC